MLQGRHERRGRARAPFSLNQICDLTRYKTVFNEGTLEPSNGSAVGLQLTRLQQSLGSLDELPGEAKRTRIGAARFAQASAPIDEERWLGVGCFPELDSQAHLCAFLAHPYQVLPPNKDISTNDPPVHTYLVLSVPVPLEVSQDVSPRPSVRVVMRSNQRVSLGDTNGRYSGPDAIPFPE